MRKVDVFADWVYRTLGVKGLLHLLIALILTDLISHISSFLAILIVGAISIGKEVYDMNTGGKFSIKDIKCDAVGIIIGLII